VTEAQVIEGNSNTHGVTMVGRLDRIRRVSQRVFDRIDAHVHRAGYARKRTGNRRLAGAWQTAEDDEEPWCITHSLVPRVSIPKSWPLVHVNGFASRSCRLLII
jgi:hypothetical protein